ncbi:hypothetical protein GAN98_24105 [Bacteroides thetaiotaomicron]|uniref:Lipoprotein n=1 Tax=Bacteroides thetaiotaomicron TaxID=818 RepID=A0A6I0S1E2_BACT4|nr:hypothetical protein GAN98_24105 [Bacteroides thetaiotaomicron]KAB4459238.1 hypothetical protein GAN67_24050 [Bacteroides thetaiotaomicron]KAB4468190.1 hypothetical protein GAN76_24020 [Bacteroides thetaiotaomicron]KAB4468275.1 hypothetical protein GAN59_24085 [Bacteroides thetaiotaomicron]KAB4479592.1 hypothetical protein GAN57_24035 [Bacteroides thetaiotaomicron]
MKQKLFFLVLLVVLIPCFVIQSCDSKSEGSTILNEGDRVAEMFRQAGFTVEELSKSVNPPMTEKEALLFLKAYKNRERSGSVQIPLSNIEQRADGSLVMRVRCNSGQKNYLRTRASDNEEFEFTHWTDYGDREISLECYRDVTDYWHSKNVQCDYSFSNVSSHHLINLTIKSDTGLSTSCTNFSINATIKIGIGMYAVTVYENFDYTLTLTWSHTAYWIASLSWKEV